MNHKFIVFHNLSTLCVISKVCCPEVAHKQLYLQHFDIGMVPFVWIIHPVEICVTGEIFEETPVLRGNKASTVGVEATPDFTGFFVRSQGSLSHPTKPVNVVVIVAVCIIVDRVAQ